MKKKEQLGVVYKTDLEEQIFAVEFSPYEWSKNLISVGLQSKIIIASVTFPEEQEDEDDDEMEEESDNGDIGGFSFKVIREFFCENRIQCLAWGPDTSLKGLPQVISFAVATSNHQITVHTSDLSMSHHAHYLEGHHSYINSMAFDPEGSLLASVSDDLTCQLWNMRKAPAHQQKTKSDATFWLNSPGMAVSWHPAEPGKLLVAEKNGLLQLFHIENQQPLLSLDAGQVPLMAAHWAPSNSHFVAALAGGELITWDLSRPSRAVEVRPVHAQGGKWLRFCSSCELIVATLGRPGHELKVCNTRAKLPILATTLPAGMFGITKKAPQVAEKGAKMISTTAGSTLSELTRKNGLFIRVAGLSGAAAVALGAYGAHTIYLQDIPQERKTAFETANRYHFFHTLALMGIPLCRRPVISGILMASGTLIFCGSCYHYALTGNPNMKPVTPYGGVLLIVAWISLML